MDRAAGTAASTCHRDKAKELRWEGHYIHGTTRGCWQETALEPGTRLTSKVCWGLPRGERDVTDFRCSEVSFAYGDPVVEVELMDAPPP